MKIYTPTSQHKKVQLEDIASVLGLSKSTVSRAISGKGRISAETRKRVLKCIDELNYRPNIIAKSLSESLTYNIGVVIPMDQSDAEAPFFQTCITGIVRECAEKSYDAVIIGTEKNDLSQLIRVVENRKVDGVIITRPLSDNSMEKMLWENGMPFVVVGKSMMEGAITVDSNHKDGCRELTSYLLMSNPHEQVGLLMGDMKHMVNKSRYSGFESAFEIIGAKPSANMVYTDIETSLQFSKAVSSLMANKPHCIICGDDMLCMKLLAELNNRSISIPDDVRVASFYDSVHLDNYIPSVTSLIFDAGELGASAAGALMKTIEGDTAMDIILDFQMLIRKSTM